jgi:hypothetical protein
MGEGYTANKKKARSKSVEKIKRGSFFGPRLANPQRHMELRKRVCDEE